MSEKQSSNILIRRSYNDFDQFTDEIKTWNLDFKQLDRGPFKGEITQFVAPSLQFARARFHRRLYQSGLPPANLKTFVIPADAKMKLYWRGKHLGGSDLLSFPAGAELDSVSGCDFDIITVSLPKDSLLAAAEEIGSRNLAREFEAEDTRRCDSKTIGALRNRLFKLQQSLETTSGLPTDRAAPLSRELAHRIATTWIGGTSGQWRMRKSARARIVDMALNHIHRQSGDPISMGELCFITGASERTLQYCFQERFGVSPKQYQQAHRLVGARRDLRKSKPGATKIADVANRWGFWHMGQFAADYRKQFGELPSETLER